jgi:hypothetical protein
MMAQTFSVRDGSYPAPFWVTLVRKDSFRRPPPVEKRLEVHLLSVSDAKCVHYHFLRDKEGNIVETARCLNGVAVPVAHQKHGFLCFQHMPKMRSHANIPSYAWDDNAVDALFIVEHDRRLGG